MRQYVNRDGGTAIFILLAGIGVCLILFHYSVSNERDQARLNFRLLAEENVYTVVKQITENVTIIDAVASYFSVSDHVSRREFANFVRPFLRKNKSIQALQWVPLVPHRDRARYEAAARRDGLSGFRFKEQSRHNLPKTAGVRSDYFVVYYNEPSNHARSTADRHHDV
jgi:CHASE1-domain containing sensor protein